MDRGDIKRVNLALQVGGAHGAFGRGVLDKLAEDGRLDAFSAGKWGPCPVLGHEAAQFPQGAW